MRERLFCLSLALLLAACYTGKRAAAPADARDPETQVYAAALDARYVADTTLLGSDAKMLLVVDDTTADLKRFLERKSEMRFASKEVLDDFEAKNRESRPLKSDFGLRIRTRPISAEETTRLLVPVKDGIPNSNRIHEKYPEASGVIMLSRVGFNRDMTEALVEVDRGLCGKGCGEGTFVLLVREGGRWKVWDYYGSYMA